MLRYPFRAIWLERHHMQTMVYLLAHKVFDSKSKRKDTRIERLNQMLWLGYRERRCQVWNIYFSQMRAFYSFWYTLFPPIVSAETILFWIWPYVLWPLVTIHKSAETIQGRKLFKGGNYSRAETIRRNTVISKLTHPVPAFTDFFFLGFAGTNVAQSN